MPVVTSCPDCARKLRVPDELLGKKARCPGCKGIFTVTSESRPTPPQPREPSSKPREERFEEPTLARPGPPPTSERNPAQEEIRALDRQQGKEQKVFFEQDNGEELARDQFPGEADPDADPRGQQPQLLPAEWRKTQLGVLLLLIGVGLFSVAISAHLLAALVGTYLGPHLELDTNGRLLTTRGIAGAEALIQVLSVVAFVLNSGWFAVKAVAYFFFLGVAERLAAKRLVVLMLAAMGAELFALLTTIALALALRSGIAAFIFVLIFVGVFIAETGVCLWFLRAVSTALSARALVKTWRLLLLLFAAFMGTSLLMGVMVMVSNWVTSARVVDLVAGCAGCVTCLVALGWDVWYIVALFQLNGELRDRVNRG
jgi:hypothetical protein